MSKKGKQRPLSYERLKLSIELSHLCAIINVIKVKRELTNLPVGNMANFSPEAGGSKPTPTGWLSC